jgi:hypothetical protein
MTLVKHTAKNRNMVWQIIELKLSEIEGNSTPYSVTAQGKNAIHVSAHKTIDEALEQMQELRDEVVL